MTRTVDDTQQALIFRAIAPRIVGILLYTITYSETFHWLERY